MSIWVGTAGGGDPSLPGRVTTLEDTEYVYELWESIASGTTGTITLASGAVILLDRYQGAADALIVALQTGVPGDQPVYTTAPALVTTTFDTFGNYTLSGAPATYPVAIIYQVKIKAKYAHLIPLSSVIQKTDVSSGGSGTQQVYVQTTNPGLTGPGIWIETGLAPGGTGFTFWFEDGL
jgi:hypothetical protein